MSKFKSTPVILYKALFSRQNYFPGAARPIFWKIPIFLGPTCTFQYFSTSRFTQRYSSKISVKDDIQTYIRENKKKLRNTEQKIKDKGNILLQDIKETTDKVKEKIIEKENIYTIPNLLCISRIVLSPYLGVLIVQDDFNLALAILGVAAVTDLVNI